MTALEPFWLPWLCLLGAEVGLVVASVALLQRRFTTPAARRALCQVGVAAVLVLAASEFSGLARILADWATGTRPTLNVELAPATVDPQAAAQSVITHPVSPAFRSRFLARLAQRSLAVGHRNLRLSTCPPTEAK